MCSVGSAGNIGLCEIVCERQRCVVVNSILYYSIIVHICTCVERNASGGSIESVTSAGSVSSTSTAGSVDSRIGSTQQLFYFLITQKVTHTRSVVGVHIHRGAVSGIGCVRMCSSAGGGAITNTGAGINTHTNTARAAVLGVSVQAVRVDGS